MKRVAFLVMQDPGDFVTDYHLGIEPLAALGWEVDEVPWQNHVDWNAYEAVYICTPWDYPEHLDQFLEVLRAIDASRALLLNDLSTVQWNLQKTYLRDVEDRGGAIVPSTWYDHFESAEPFFAEHGSDKLVIKPTVGANAMDTFVLTNPVPSQLEETLRTKFRERPFFVQPFIDNIQSEGEYSLFYFNGEYSHAILKTPAAGDFRVQEEHGADIRSVQPPATLLATGTEMFASMDPLPVYGRGDWVRGDDDRWLLMELELIEPSLYLRTDSGAATRFAAAFDQRFEEFAGK